MKRQRNSGREKSVEDASSYRSSVLSTQLTRHTSPRTSDIPINDQASCGLQTILNGRGRASYTERCPRGSAGGLASGKGPAFQVPRRVAYPVGPFIAMMATGRTSVVLILPARHSRPTPRRRRPRFMA